MGCSCLLIVVESWSHRSALEVLFEVEVVLLTIPGAHLEGCSYREERGLIDLGVQRF